MEVLSLALLAAASGGFLLKARSKSKKEGFSESNAWISENVNGYNLQNLKVMLSNVPL